MEATAEYKPASYALTLDRTETGWTEKSRAYFAEVCKGLEPGTYEVVMKRRNDNYRTTRYRYYFGHVLTVILLTSGDKFQVLDGDEFRPVRDTSEIHDALKMKYNPVIIKTPFGAFTVPSSTTSLSDRDFIGKFEQEILAEFSGPPWNCDFMTREEYGRLMSGR